jgi:aspartokinase
VVCIDGCADEYLSTSMAHNRMPHITRLARSGYRGLVRSALPSFTNVNNCCIVTGTSPRQTGICGNYILDPETGQEVMTNSSHFLRNETILAAAAHSGRKVAMVTAKDKLLYDDQIGKVSLIGAGMRSHPGITARFFAALAGAGTNIEMISTSEIRISVIVDEAQVDAAVQATHSAFDLDADEVEAVVYGGTGR